MTKLSNLLVVVEQGEHASAVLQKAERLALATDAELHVLRVVYDPIVDAEIHRHTDRQRFKAYLLEVEDVWLDNFIRELNSEIRLGATNTAWHKDEHVAVIEAATRCRADLVIKAAHRPEGIDRVVHTPQDWALLRHSRVPVMLLKPDPWRRNGTVLAAIDVLASEQRALNESVLALADNLADILDSQLDVVVAYPLVQPWISPNTVPVDYERIRREVDVAIRRGVDEVASASAVSIGKLYIGEGPTATVVGQHVDRTGAELLVMGTVAREGLSGLVLGNTSESILYRVQCDVVVTK